MSLKDKENEICIKQIKDGSNYIKKLFRESFQTITIRISINQIIIKIFNFKIWIKLLQQLICKMYPSTYQS